MPDFTSVPKFHFHFQIPDDWLTIQNFANLTVMLSPVTSYGGTIISIVRHKSLGDYSPDISGIMILSCILRVFYYSYHPYEKALLHQSIVMILVHCLLLYVALKYRPPHRDTPHEKVHLNLRLPAAGGSGIPSRRRLGAAGGVSARAMALAVFIARYIAHLTLIVPFRVLKYLVKLFDPHTRRPGDFWQWKTPGKYWSFLARYVFCLGVCQITVAPILPLYSVLIGNFGLCLESLLPLPQILLFHRIKTSQGFPAFLIFTWLSGDLSKILYLTSGITHEISAPFICFGLLQTCLDIIVGCQFVYYRLYPSVPLSTQLPSHEKGGQDSDYSS